MFGDVKESPQNEDTPFRPRSPYGCAKVFGHYQTINYREAYGMFAVSGILFNHESERRGEGFVTRKITLGMARIAQGLQDKLVLGNLDTARDWGYAPDYVQGMWLMLQQPEPKDYVLATGETHTVREFCAAVASHLGIPDWEAVVRMDPEFLRPCEVASLCGNASRARVKLGWSPKVGFRELVRRMADHDMRHA
jgi:GDPmannose 4,6-dehydratase